MTYEIALVLLILGVSLVLFINERLRMDVVSMLVLSALAVTGLVTPTEALSGFSNPAVITVWAMFILSDALTRTGVSNFIGRQVLHLAGTSETRMIIVIMLAAGVMSAFMNNIGIAALMLPVLIEIARRTDNAPSRLLMPLAFATLLGGLTTLIATPPNLLASEALRQSGHSPFGLLDYLPVGLSAMLAGIAFVAFFGRHLLPVADPAKESKKSTPSLRQQYALDERRRIMRIPEKSILVGKSLAESRLGAAVGLNVVALIRDEHSQLAPVPSVILQAKDKLVVQGRLERFEELCGWSELKVKAGDPGLKNLATEQVVLAEMRIRRNSTLLKQTLYKLHFHSTYGLNVLAIRTNGTIKRTDLSDIPLSRGDRLLLQGHKDTLEAMKSDSNDEFFEVSKSDLDNVYQLQERVFSVEVPEHSRLAGETLAQSRLGEALDLRVLGIIRNEELNLLPDPNEKIQAQDVLLMQGKLEELSILQGLQELEITSETAPDLELLKSERVGMVEAILAPRSSLAGKSMRDLRFRERYGLQVLAIWRESRSYRSNLRDMKLEFGDGILLLGPREKLVLLGNDPDFILLTPVKEKVYNTKKAPIAALIMLAILTPVLMGLMPIAVAAVIGATLMVACNCISMDDAYRSIEWRSIFLIAGMLPMGTALESSGAAAYLAECIMSTLGSLGPWPVIWGLYILTALTTTIIPTAALVVLMAPITIKACVDMGVSPHAGMMAVAMAASASFTSPIAHPANALVMGPGGYKFSDYVKLGTPLALVVMVTVMIVLPIFWPLHP